MVSIDKGHVLMVGDSICIAMEIIAFLGSINDMKKHDYATYKEVEKALILACKDEEACLETIKEFALNMTEAFS